MISLEGSTAVVTGAGSGIGRSTAEKLAEAGADVALLDLRGAADAASAIRDRYGRRTHAGECDVTDPDSVTAAFTEVALTLGRPSILVNSAGVIVAGDVATGDPADWQRQLAVNVGGPLNCSRAFLRPLLEERAPGRIVNIASVSAFRGSPGFPAYCASKAAVVSLTRQMAVDYSGAGISVNAVAPGFVHTPMTDMYSAEVKEVLTRETPRGMWARPADIANAVAFLSSELAAHVCGATLVVDGGWLAGIPAA